MIVMFQTMQNWESRKRTTSAGSDAQVAGAIAIFNLERDIRLAGFGFGGATQVGCTVSGYDAVRGAAIPGFLMVPVSITQGSLGVPDTLTILYGNGTTVSAGIPYTGSTANTKTASNADGIKQGDLIIAADSSGNCGLFETTSNPPGTAATLSHLTTGYTNYLGSVVATPRYNNGTEMTITNGATAGGTLYNMGMAPQLNVWQVSGGLLTVRNDIANETAGSIAEGVGNMRAQYLDASGAVLAAPSTVATWQSVRAIRVALLARSQQYEATLVTANPVWAGGNFGMTDLTAGSTSDTDPDGPNNWRRYRYRVYETVVPLRNISWGLS